MNIGLVEAKSIILASLSLSYVVVGLETQFYLIYVCDIARGARIYHRLSFPL